MTPPRLFLIDAMSQIFRAFYAIRDLRNSHGLPTNAVYGFIAMLRKLVEQEKPFYLGAVFDPPGPTLRHLQYQAYKANRKPTPKELILQIPYVQRFCRAMNIPVLQIEGYEADDVIGTLTAQAEAVGLESVVVSIDKDMCQLVDERTFLLDTRQEYVYLDRHKVIERMGVPPEKIVDLLSLWGDSSDNVPGAPGIGEKGALELIRRFGSVQECLARWAEAEKKVHRQSLRDHAELIRQSCELVTIHRHLPIVLDLDRLAVGPPDADQLTELYRELEFHSLLAALPKRAEAAPLLERHRIEGPRDRDAFLAEVGRAAGWAFQTDADERATCIHFALPPNRIYSLSLESPEEDIVAVLRGLEKTPGGAAFDLKSFYLFTERLLPGWTSDADDVMLMGHLTNAGSGGITLPQLILRCSGKQPGAGGRADGQSALDILELSSLLKKTLEEKQLSAVYTDMEKPLTRVLADMEIAGIALDAPLLENLSGDAALELDSLRRQICALAGTEFNLDSPKQVGEILFDKLQLPVLKRTRKTKSHSTDQEVLEELAAAHEVPRLLLEYRQLAKLKSTYMDALPRLAVGEARRIHASFNQAATSTGRLSSSNPNLQNIPTRTPLGRRIREAFCAAPGCLLLAADYSQIELRIMAHLSQDEAMIAAFQAREDIHARTAREVFGMTAQLYPEECRRRAKVINFGILYGLSAFGLAKDLQISRPEAQRFIDRYFSRYPGIAVWIQETTRLVQETGEVRTLFGRIRPIPEVKSSDKNVRAFGERAAVNAPIQGTAADLIKLAMIRLRRALAEQGYRSRILLQVHDELVLEVPREELSAVNELVKEVLCNVYLFRVPLEVETGYGINWKEAKA